VVVVMMMMVVVVVVMMMMVVVVMMVMMMMQAKTAELNTVNVKIEELVRSSVEKDAEAGKELSAKMKTLAGQFEKLSGNVQKRIKMAAANISFQKRVKQVCKQ